MPESTPTEIPTTMKRLVVMAPGEDLKSCKIEIEQDVPVPKPTASQLLIKVVAAAINPSDYGSWYRCKPEQCPYVMGKEGCGIVVATGGGLTTKAYKIGAHVGFTALKNNQGSYSEYVVVEAVGGAVFTMPNDLPLEDAASFFVNPYTAIAILDTVTKDGGSSKVLVHTAAASQLGQMLVKLASTEGIELINVVRREEQAELLRKIGAKHIIVTGSGDAASDNNSWKQALETKIKELGATIAMDAVAGRMTGDLLDVMPPKGTVYVYGGLAGRVENVNPMDLIYKEKKIKGFYLGSWIHSGGLVYMLPRLMSASRKVNAGLKNGGWSSSQFKDTTLEKAFDDIVKLLDSSITGQKLRIRFDK